MSTWGTARIGTVYNFIDNEYVKYVCVSQNSYESFMTQRIINNHRIKCYAQFTSTTKCEKYDEKKNKKVAKEINQ